MVYCNESGRGTKFTKECFKIWTSGVFDRQVINHLRLSLKPVYVNPVHELAEDVKGKQFRDTSRGLHRQEKSNDVQ